MRKVAEWISKHDDQAIPARVQIRIFDKFGGKCAECGRAIGGTIRAAYDHIVALCNGGANAEHNVSLLCLPCHKVKTAADVAEKSKVNRVKAKHLGITKPKRPIGSRGFDKREPQHTATRPIERRS